MSLPIPLIIHVHGATRKWREMGRGNVPSKNNLGVSPTRFGDFLNTSVYPLKLSATAMQNVENDPLLQNIAEARFPCRETMTYLAPRLSWWTKNWKPLSGLGGNFLSFEETADTQLQTQESTHIIHTQDCGEVLSILSMIFSQSPSCTFGLWLRKERS